MRSEKELVCLPNFGAIYASDWDHVADCIFRNGLR